MWWLLQALESSAQQKKKQVIMNRTVKAKGKVQKPKKIKATAKVLARSCGNVHCRVSTFCAPIQLAVPKPPSATSSVLPTLPALSSTSSWSSGDSDGECPEAKRGKVASQPLPSSNGNCAIPLYHCELHMKYVPSYRSSSTSFADSRGCSGSLPVHHHATSLTNPPSSTTRHWEVYG